MNQSSIGKAKMVFEAKTIRPSWDLEVILLERSFSKEETRSNPLINFCGPLCSSTAVPEF